MSRQHLPWRVAGAIGATAACLGLAKASVIGIPTAQGHQAAVRLSWSARPERIEQCRRLSDEELAQRPAHMRLRFECSGAFARYLLAVTLDGDPVITDTIRGGGLRHDRPMHLFQEVRVAPGARQVTVTLARIDSATGAPSDAEAVPGDTLLGAREARELDERRRRAGEAIPPTLLLDTALTLRPQQVLLVTYDGQSRRLVARTEQP